MHFCANCNDIKEFSLGEKEEFYPIKGEEIKICAQIYFCTDCNAEITTDKTEENNYLTASKYYRSKHNLMHPDEIRSVREKYGLSQRAFARLLGWSDTIFSYYERGRIQDSAHNETLLLLEKPSNMKEIYEKQKISLSLTEQETIESKLRLLIEKEREKQWHSLFCDFPVDAYTGYRKFDFHKFSQMIFLLLKLNRNLFKTKLLKLLFYSDMLYYKMYGTSISGARYVKITYGPVPDNYKHYLAKLEKDGHIIMEEVPFPNGNSGDQFSVESNIEIDLLSKNEMKILRAVSKYFAKYNSTQIRDYSHKEMAFINTTDGELINYKEAHHINVKLE